MREVKEQSRTEFRLASLKVGGHGLVYTQDLSFSIDRPDEDTTRSLNLMQHIIKSEVAGVINLTQGEQYLRIEQTAPDGSTHEMRFPPAEAADVALRALYVILSGSGGKALATQSPFYNEVKGML